MKWYFYYPRRFTFFPPDLLNAGLGGSEASLVLLTEELASRGHQVEVYGCCYKPGSYNNVAWRMLWELETAPTPDVFVSVRFLESICPTLSVEHRLFWMLEDRWKGASEFLRLFGHAGGQVITPSNSMSQFLLSHVPEASQYPIQIIPLPVRRFTEPISTQERDLACLYCSIHDRGLDALLEFWPSISDAIPEVQLWITGGYQLWGYTNEQAEGYFDKLLGRYLPLQDPRITVFGVLPKVQLSELQARCALLLYPCRYPEMFCLSAAECTAYGTPIITSAKDALKERVLHEQNGLLIDGNIEGAETQQHFVEATIRLLQDPVRRTQMSQSAFQLAENTRPEVVAAQWEQMVQS